MIKYMRAYTVLSYENHIYARWLFVFKIVLQRRNNKIPITRMGYHLNSFLPQFYRLLIVKQRLFTRILNL